MTFRETLEKAKQLAKINNCIYAIWENNSPVEDYLCCPNGTQPPITTDNGVTYSQLFLVTPSGTVSQ